MKILLITIILLTTTLLHANNIDKKKLAYLVTNINIPFWEIMSRGIKQRAELLGYELKIYNSQNSAKRELELTVEIMKDKVSGIIVSPSNSSACVSILKLAKGADIPVVISDVGADSDEYVSYISSNNKDGAYNMGEILSKKLIELGWNNGKVGIIAIPQKRLNGQERTAGFMKALNENGIKSADIRQLKTWTDKETYNFTKDMIKSYPELRAIWLQTSNMYNGAIKAIYDSGKKDDILLVLFDAEPEFIDLISKGIIVGSGMQQPYLMGETAINMMHDYLSGIKVKKNILLPILPITTENIMKNLPNIKRNVLGYEN